MFNDVAAYLKTKKLTNFSVKWTSQRSSFFKCNEVTSRWRCPFPEAGDLYHSIVCIDQFSKWAQANPIKDKDALAVAQSLYKLSCFGCFEIKINKQFVNFVPKELRALTGIEQRFTSTYHLQPNKLVERQNRSITKH